MTELPLLFKSSRGGSLAVMSVFDKYFKNEFKDVKVLWFWVHPPGHFHLAKKPVHKLEDLSGLKIRAATPMLTNMVKLLGAIPGEHSRAGHLHRAGARHRGRHDLPVGGDLVVQDRRGAEASRVGRALRRAAVHADEPEEVRQPAADLRKVIDDLSGNCGAEFNGKVWDPNEQVGIDAIKKAGGTIYTVPAEEKQRWAAKLKPMEEDWVKSMEAKGLPGRQLLNDLREAIKKYDP